MREALQRSQLLTPLSVIQIVPLALYQILMMRRMLRVEVHATKTVPHSIDVIHPCFNRGQ